MTGGRGILATLTLNSVMIIIGELRHGSHCSQRGPGLWLALLSLSRVIITMTPPPHFATLATITSPLASDTNGHGKLYGNGNHENTSECRPVIPL